MKKIMTIMFITLELVSMQSSGQDIVRNDLKRTEVNSVKQRFAEMEVKALTEAYQGIFSEKGRIPDLFPIYSTGVSTEPIVAAAELFLSSLNGNQYNRTTFEIEDEEWRKWCNVDNGVYDRQGVSLKEMTEQQKDAAFSLMKASLSAKGLQLSRDIMKTDHTLKELNNGSADYDEELYFFSLMGDPSETTPWGWQLDGHHLVINYFILGDQVVMSPVFMGGEPIVTTTGKYIGNTLFQDEQNFGLGFMLSLSKEQQIEATISASKIGNSNKAKAFKDNLSLNYEGLMVSQLPDQQKDNLLHLISLYISNIKEGHQQVKMKEVRALIDNTWFAWIGDTSEDAVFYYRIHNPVVLIEFDHQRAVSVPGVDRDNPTRNHIHTIVRTPNGNDYGKDLLQKHLESHKH